MSAGRLLTSLRDLGFRESDFAADPEKYPRIQGVAESVEARLRGESCNAEGCGERSPSREGSIPSSLTIPSEGPSAMEAYDHGYARWWPDTPRDYCPRDPAACSCDEAGAAPGDYGYGTCPIHSPKPKLTPDQAMAQLNQILKEASEK